MFWLSSKNGCTANRVSSSSLIHLNCNTAGFFPKSLFKGVKHYSVEAEFIDCSRVLDCTNKIKFCSLSSIVLNNNFTIVPISFWFVEV